MSRDSEKRHTIPVTEEELSVNKRRKTTGGVRVYKTVHKRQEVVDEPLLDTDVEVKRVSVGDFVDEPAQTRQEGDTTIVPVHEEVIVTEKRLRLKEEVHITRREVNRRRPQSVTVRSEQAHIEDHDESEQ